uniref:Vacuolar assembly family protein n=1 Tax=Rhizophora mucronata TaxID=61149 RepID=A0A2P2MIT3_RHIMU
MKRRICCQCYKSNLISSITKSRVFSRYIGNQCRKLTQVSKMEDPSAKGSPHALMNKLCQGNVEAIGFHTSPMQKLIHATIWDTRMQLQHISFQ